MRVSQDHVVGKAPSALDYRWALGPGFGDLVVSDGAGSGSGQSRASLTTPQGSPLSPILSAVYTIPLLRLAERWVWLMLSLYVDDGNLTAAGPTHQESVKRVVTGFRIVSDRLKHCGLRTDPDKTEFISFFNPRWSQNLKGSPPHNIILQDASNGELSVPRSPSVRYLGIFIYYKLSWDLHIRTMANRARSTICALHMLGNSI